jgi:hypothetical protein
VGAGVAVRPVWGYHERPGHVEQYCRWTPGAAEYRAYEHRSAHLGSGAAECSGWIAALAGLWVLITPSALSGSITAGTIMWSNVIVGVIAAILAAYAGYAIE